MQTLQNTYFAVAIVFALVAAIFFCGNERVKKFCLGLPRSDFAGRFLWAAALVWFFYHLYTLDEVDFAGFPRWPVIVVFMAAGTLAFKYLSDLLSLRALAVLTLFGANELLKIGYTFVPYSRVLAGTVYLFVIAALFVGASPYLLRNWLTWSFGTRGHRFVAGTLFALLALANAAQGAYLFWII
ncbi:MAG: hypothetical protein K6B46_01355 [Opitutales bacterium]|nr:hypothetical protein [Opitutales bacterium]